MTGPVFVDTNVFVYLYDSAQPDKQKRAKDWVSLLMRERIGKLSFQVLQELYVTLTQKLRRSVTRREAQQIIRGLMSWNPVPADSVMMERSWAIQERYDLSWWDSLIVAAALRCECTCLLTEDLQHEQVISQNLRVMNPFKSPQLTPGEVLHSIP